MSTDQQGSVRDCYLMDFWHHSPLNLQSSPKSSGPFGEHEKGVGTTIQVSRDTLPWRKVIWGQGHPRRTAKEQLSASTAN